MLQKNKITMILGLESLESKGLQGHSRGDLNPLDDVKDGRHIVESNTNNIGGDNLGFRLRIKISL
jgi:hypothetical protein